MKILFCSHNPLDSRLGAPKVVIEVAEELRKLGAQCRLVADSEILPDVSRYQGLARSFHFARALRDYLRRHSGDYDVIDYDHVHLPFEHRSYNSSSLFVARSVLLTHHLERTRLPRFNQLRSHIGAVVMGPRRALERKAEVFLADRTIRHADLVNVSNHHDRAELERRGFASNKIVVVPFGMTESRLAEFSASSPNDLPSEPRIAFVGTFDARKGGPDLVKLLAVLAERVPGIKLRLIGARYRSEGEIQSYFPEQLRAQLEVVPKFDPKDLARHLADCRLGVFPSYVEGFGFAVLEMLASALPVVAYDAPGPPMMLPPELLVAPGDIDAFAAKVTALLSDERSLCEKRRWAKARAGDFLWSAFGKRTLEIYEERLRALRSSS